MDAGFALEEARGVGGVEGDEQRTVRSTFADDVLGGMVCV